MKRQFKYPKNFEEQKRIPKLTQKRIKLAEISLGDFEGKLANDLLNSKRFIKLVFFNTSALDHVTYGDACLL